MTAKKWYSIGMFVSGIIIELFLFTLFPDAGLGQLITVPIVLVFSFLIAVAFYFLSKKVTGKALLALIFIVSISLIFILAYNIHPSQESDRTLQNEIAAARDSYSNYADLSYADIFEINHPYARNAKRIAALHKFRDQLPDSALKLEYYQLDDDYQFVFREEFYLAFKEGQIHSNRQMLSLQETLQDTLFIADTLHNRPLTFVVYSQKEYHRKAVEIRHSDRDLKIFSREISLQPIGTLHRWYYSILDWLK